MILYGSYTSPYVRHCRIALNVAAIDYEFVETDYAGSDRGSATKRVPFLVNGDLKLTDSSSILLQIKQLQGEAGFVDVHDFELYALVNTVMDTEINLFLLTKDSAELTQVDYVQRQKARVQSGLVQLDALMQNASWVEHDYSDGQIRLACLLDWGLFRERFSLTEHKSLQRFLNSIREWEAFSDTDPAKT